MTRKARLGHYPFEFQPEKPQKVSKGHEKRVDLAVRINTCDIDMAVVYCIEAKKLPTDRTGGEREREYVIGAKGGIQRFKEEAHGKDDDGNLLPRNGMVAYITAHDFHYWHNQINQWIAAASWPKSEALAIGFIREIGRLNSAHSRISGSAVQLAHFWVKV